MRTLHPAYRVRHLDRSLAFYTQVGYEEIGRVALDDGSILLMLSLPGDNDDVTLELVYDPNLDPLTVGDGFSHLAVQVDDLRSTITRLNQHGIDVDGPHDPNGDGELLTAFVRDPDGYRIEFVQWPTGHPARLTRADFES